MYGELRLSRLNSLHSFGAAGFSLSKLVYGYMFGLNTAHNILYTQHWMALGCIHLHHCRSVCDASGLGNGQTWAGRLLPGAFVLVAVAAVLGVWTSPFLFPSCMNNPVLSALWEQTRFPVGR
jgi:hypothetical protein